VTNTFRTDQERSLRATASMSWPFRQNSQGWRHPSDQAQKSWKIFVRHPSREIDGLHTNSELVQRHLINTTPTTSPWRFIN